MSHLAVWGRRRPALGGAGVWPYLLWCGTPEPPLDRRWGSESSSCQPQRATGGTSQLLLARLDACVGLPVQGDIAALPGIQVEQRVFYHSWIEGLLPKLCLLQFVGPWGGGWSEDGVRG